MNKTREEMEFILTPVKEGEPYPIYNTEGAMVNNIKKLIEIVEEQQKEIQALKEILKLHAEYKVNSVLDSIS